MCLLEAVFQTHLGVYCCLTKDNKTKSAPCSSFALGSDVYRFIEGTQTQEQAYNDGTSPPPQPTQSIHHNTMSAFQQTKYLLLIITK